MMTILLMSSFSEAFKISLPHLGFTVYPTQVHVVNKKITENHIMCHKRRLEPDSRIYMAMRDYK